MFFNGPFLEIGKKDGFFFDKLIIIIHLYSQTDNLHTKKWTKF